MRWSPRPVVLCAVLASVLMVGLLSACTPDGEAPASANPTPTAGPVLLQMAVYGPPQVITAYTKIAADFTAQHPQVVVNVRPFDTKAEAMRSLRRSLASQNPPNLFLTGVRNLPRLEARGVLRRVDDLLGKRKVDFGDGFVRGALEAYSADTALQCMPIDYSPMVIYYNTDLVDPAKAADPGANPVNTDNGWSMDEFARAVRRASHGGHKGVYIAPDLAHVAPFIWSGGGEVADDPTHPTTMTLAGGSSQDSLQQLLELVRNPRVTYGQQQLARRSALKRFEAGHLAMLAGFRSLTPVLRHQQGLHFAVMPMPRLRHKATIGQSNGMCLAKGAPHLAETADFLAYLISDDAMGVLAQTGYVVPTSLNVLSSDAFLQPGQLPSDVTPFTNQLRYVHELPSSPHWSQAAAVADSILARLFYDPVIDPLEQRLTNLDEQTASILVPPTESSSPSPRPSGTASPGRG